MKNYDVVIMAGGFGTRMSKDFSDIPKPLIPLGESPILEHIISECKKYNRINILIVLHHMSDKIKNYFGDGSSFGVKIKYFVEEIPMGTGGALLAVQDLLKDTYLVLYADVYSDLNIDDFFNFHSKHESEISIVVHPNDHPYDSDIVEIKNNKVLRFSSHPHIDNVKKNLVNAAMYIINKSAFLHLSDMGNSKFDIAQDIFPDLLKKDVNILAYRTSEYIKDMGTPERLIINNLDDLELIKYSGNAIRMINKSKFLAICATNQPVIARGECSSEQLERIHNKMESDLGSQGAYLDHIYFCPHHPDSGFKGEVKELKIQCNCRKPNPGMLINAQKDFNLNLKECWFIGDSEADIGAAQNAGCKSILVGDNYDVNKIKYKPTATKKNIFDAVRHILYSD